MDPVYTNHGDAGDAAGVGVAPEVTEVRRPAKSSPRRAGGGSGRAQVSQTVVRGSAPAVPAAPPPRPDPGYDSADDFYGADGAGGAEEEEDSAEAFYGTDYAGPKGDIYAGPYRGEGSW